MLTLSVWLALMGAGGLCYPRRPRVAGLLFLASAGAVSIAWAAGAIGDNPPFVALTSIALGIGNLWRFRTVAVRAAHIAEWTANRA